MITITAKRVETGQLITFNAAPFLNGHVMMAETCDGGLFAELDLARPENGWLIFPN